MPDNPNINIARVANTAVDATGVPVKILSGSGGAATVADGANVVEGSTTDAAVVTDVSGTLSGKLRGLVKIFADVWDSVNHRLKIDGSGVTQPVSIAASVLTTNANLDVALSTRTKPSDQQHVIVDSSASIAVTGPLTDTQIRATALPISATNLDVALSTRTKPADQQHTILDSGALTSITNPVAVTLATAPTTAVTVADGSNVVEGLTTDTAAQGDSIGTLSAKLRGINIALTQLSQSSAKNTAALLAQQALYSQNQNGFVSAPEVPAFLGGF